MNLIKLDNLQLHQGEQRIFFDLSLLLKKGDRLCIIGRNGVGKSTLLKTLEGLVEPDAGSIWREASVKVASLQQDLPEFSDMPVYEFVASGLASLGRDLAKFQFLSQQHNLSNMQELGEVQQRIESQNGWSLQNTIQQVLTRLDLDGDALMSSLSGGWRRRVALARALVCQPDVLLLDEPTNHLDIVSIEWLEKQLQNFQGAVVFVTHDRAFLRAVANRIGELDRGQLAIWNGDYSSFLVFREQKLAEEAKHNAEFDKKLAQEEVWIRQGIKARRTRNEGRVRALKDLRQERAARIERSSQARMAISGDVSSGKLVAEFKNVVFAWQDKVMVDHFSGSLLRGDKIGLIGPNGIGKTTFLKLIVGSLKPTSGEVALGTQLSISYFDQLRDELDLNKSAMDNISEGRDFIDINGKSKHIIGYLQDFLFTGERARTPLRAMSGGERNRVLLAKLFSKPANCLIMDEPTNDLDAETLELLEDLLIDYTGTLLIVSHDREFLDNVVTSTLGFEGHGKIKEYVGGYQDWIRQGGVWFTPDAPSASPKTTSETLKNESETSKKESEISKAALEAPKNDPKKSIAKKLSYKLQLELDELPQKIEILETALRNMQLVLSDPSFYQKSAQEIAHFNSELDRQQKDLEHCYARWEILENMKAS